MRTITTTEIHGHAVEIIEVESKISRTGKPLVVVEAKIDGRWTDGDWRATTAAAAATTALATITRRLTPTEPAAPATPGMVTGRTGWSRHSRGGARDQVGGYVEGAFGLTSPATARGECHYCGGELRRGQCDECI